VVMFEAMRQRRRGGAVVEAAASKPLKPRKGLGS
jgi:hypothetical protein